MMTVPTLRARALWRSLASVLSLGLAALLVVASAAPAAAASSADFLGLGPHRTVNGKLGGNDVSIPAGIMRMRIDGAETAGFCIDIHTQISVTTGKGLDEQGWDESSIRNLAEVEKILANYYPNGDGPEGFRLVGDDKSKAAGVQAAIWHYTDSFDLKVTGRHGNHDDVVKNYQTILGAKDILEGFGEPAPSLDITSPASTEGTAGSLIGPFTVTSTADKVSLSASDGTTLHNEDGSALGGEVTSGTEVYLKRADAGGGSFTASANATVKSGRVFYKKSVQRLILAGEVEVSVSDSASATWTDAGTATVRKSTIGRSGQFSFSLTGPGLPESGVSAAIDGSGEAAFDAALKPGSEYTITEIDAEGYIQTPVSCSVEHSIEGNSITFAVPQGDTAVVCDFENTATYDLIVTKDVVADEGLWAEAGFDPETDVFGVAATCTSDDVDDIVFDSVEIANGGSATFGPVPHGYACTVTEDVTGAELADGFFWKAADITPEVEIVDGEGDEVVVTNDITKDDQVETTTTTVPDTTTPGDTTPEAPKDKPSGGLPITGANSLIILAVGAALLVGGGALVISTRKRRGV